MHVPLAHKRRIDLGKSILIFVACGCLLWQFLVSATNRENSVLHEFKYFDLWLDTLHSPGKPHTPPEAWFDAFPQEVFRFLYLFNFSFLSLFLIGFLAAQSLKYFAPPPISRSKILSILTRSSYPFLLLVVYLVFEEMVYSNGMLVPDEARFGALFMSILLVLGIFLHLSRPIIRENRITWTRLCYLDRHLLEQVLVLASLIGMAIFLRFWNLTELWPNGDEATVFWDFGYVCDRIQRGKWINNLLYFIWNHPHPHLFERWASSRVPGQWTGQLAS